jgi:cell division protease FtsH
MALDAWLPVGHKLPDGAKSRAALFEGPGWQILETQGNGRALVARGELASRWIESGLLDQGSLIAFEFGKQRYWSISCNPSQVLCPVSEGKSPDTKSEALAFALAFKATREIDKESPLQDALYIEKISRLLPTYSISSRSDDDVVLGYWLTGGASVSVKSFRRLRQTLSWLGAAHLKDVVEAAGFKVTEVVPTERRRPKYPKTDVPTEEPLEVRKTPAGKQPLPRAFDLPGRPELSSFINEHIVDIVQNRERYKALGVDFPSAVVLHGPPGCGKTFAIERLVEYLEWPSFQIEASTVASPYIHETSRKVAAVFESAMQNAPSVIIIDEMEAFLTDRQVVAGSGQHHVEEVAELLRCIPEAIKNHVLVVAMTNRIEMIDPAILRRGRFDHVVKVDMASEVEVRVLLQKLVSELPREPYVDVAPLAKQLQGRPLSDVAFVVREGARLAARSGKDKLDQASLLRALENSPAREGNEEPSRRIGFIR